MNEKEQLQMELQVSEERFRNLFESALDGILIVDAENQKVIAVNPSMTALAGGSRDEITGKELWEIGLFSGMDESRSAFRELLERGYLHYEDLPLLTRTGEFRAVELTGRVYFEGEAKVAQCHVRDISQRKRAEGERGLQTQNAARLAQIAGRVARLGGWTIQLPERKLIWSDENCAIHEAPPGYRPTLEEGISYYPPEYQERVKLYVETCAKEGTPYDFELPKYTFKGKLIWVRSIGEAIRDEDGQIIGIQGAFQDITARRQVEAEKENLIKELQTALAEVRKLQEFLPICSYCKKVRDDENYWSQIESYISKHTDTKFSHSICPECYDTEVKPQLEKIKRQPR